MTTRLTPEQRNQVGAAVLAEIQRDSTLREAYDTGRLPIAGILAGEAWLKNKSEAEQVTRRPVSAQRLREEAASRTVARDVRHHEAARAALGLAPSTFTPPTSIGFDAAIASEGVKRYDAQEQARTEKPASPAPAPDAVPKELARQERRSEPASPRSAAGHSSAVSVRASAASLSSLGDVRPNTAAGAGAGATGNSTTGNNAACQITAGQGPDHRSTQKRAR
ncbi:hypothetical protein ACIBL8_47845 [Streptomyces sp. NPDC050523]|uniref:hypothetical protein n=1 Tax=Streptomyces sp. NPDC050523 TaxID=3365622 RepID=UPI0037AE6D7F